MAHNRDRNLVSLINKRLKLFPVYGILGARQVGKSTLLREQLAPIIHGKYLNFDRQDIRKRAETAPDYFIESQAEEYPLILDEVQKVPDIFDSIKAVVDENRKPNMFILSGSTEFSKKTGIRESMTGRIGLSRLYPFTISELYGRKLHDTWIRWKCLAQAVTTSAEIEKTIIKGAMPSMCFLRNTSEQSVMIENWLDTICNKDLQQFKNRKFSGQLAKDILLALAQLEEPTISEVANKLHQDIRKIRNYFEALEALFVLNRLEPHISGTGKAKYFILDSAVASYLGASRTMCIHIWAYNEIICQFEYSGNPRPQIYYYKSSKASKVDFVIESKLVKCAVKIIQEETPHTYALRSLESFSKKNDTHKVAVFCPAVSHYHEKTFDIFPWKLMV